MPIEIEWFNEQQTILYVTYKPDYTKDEIRQAQDEGLALIEERGQPVIFITDFSEIKRTPRLLVSSYPELGRTPSTIMITTPR